MTMQYAETLKYRLKRNDSGVLTAGPALAISGAINVTNNFGIVQAFVDGKLTGTVYVKADMNVVEASMNCMEREFRRLVVAKYGHKVVLDWDSPPDR